MKKPLSFTRLFTTAEFAEFGRNIFEKGIIEILVWNKNLRKIIAEDRFVVAISDVKAADENGRMAVSFIVEQEVATLNCRQAYSPDQLDSNVFTEVNEWKRLIPISGHEGMKYDCLNLPEGLRDETVQDVLNNMQAILVIPDELTAWTQIGQKL